jgi:hypothetical protein
MAAMEALEEVGAAAMALAISCIDQVNLVWTTAASISPLFLLTHGVENHGEKGQGQIVETCICADNHATLPRREGS